jgi:hypothetical protein
MTVSFTTCFALTGQHTQRERLKKMGKVTQPCIMHLMFGLSAHDTVDKRRGNKESHTAGQSSLLSHECKRTVAPPSRCQHPLLLIEVATIWLAAAYECLCT